MQPSGIATMGNYFGAIKNWRLLQNNYNCIFCVVDMHSITVRQDPILLKKKSKELATLYLACGLDPDKSTFYYQSHVSAHAELSWILNCFTYIGEASRMTQFKDKSQSNKDNVNVGLFTYPILQAADILLYKTDIVPVGEDQRQHIEFCRDIAIRFNKLFGNTFTIPEISTPKTGAKIMSLQNPTKKMSKSDPDNNSTIFLLDDPKTIVKKINRAVTDSENSIYYDSDNKPGISNLIEIYSIINNKTFVEIEQEFKNCGYGIFKTTVANSIIEELSNIQKKYNYLINNPEYVDKVMVNGSIKAKEIADKTLTLVKDKIGYVSF